MRNQNDDIMKNLLHFVLSVFVISSFLGCSGDVVKTPDEFLKQENVLPKFDRKRQVIANIGGSEKMLFVTKIEMLYVLLNLKQRK